MRSIKVIAPPSVEPVTVEEVKLNCHITHDDEDTIIAHWIRTGRELAEQYQWRAYLTQTLQVAYDNYPLFPLTIPRSPMQSLVSVQYIDDAGTTTDIDTSNFIVDTDSEPGRIALVDGYTLPTTTLRDIAGFKINFVAGHSSIDLIDNRVKDAIIIYCSHRNENRAAETSIPDTFYNLLRPNRLYLS